MSTRIEWIKINTDMFDNKKIKIIESMPDADTLLVIWVKLICEAGKLNADGWIFLSANLPYTIEELAIALDRPVNTVRLAISTFERLQMVTRDEKRGLLLNNFAEVQNTDALRKIRDQNKFRQARLRERRKLALPEANVEQKVNTDSGTVTQNVTLRNAPDKIREEKEKKRKEKNNDLKNLWDEVLKTLKTEMNPANYKLFEKDIFLVELTDSEITLGTKNEYQAGHVERQLKMRVEQAFINCGHALPVRIILIE